MSLSGKEMQGCCGEIPHGVFAHALLSEYDPHNRKWDILPDAMHFHNYLEIGYCHSGAGEMVFNTECLYYAPGTLTVIPAHCLHHTKCGRLAIDRWDYLYVNAEDFLKIIYRSKALFATELIEKINADHHVFSAEQQPDITMLLKAILNAYRKKFPLYKESVKGLLLALLIELARLDEDTAVEMEQTAGQDNVIQQALGYIRNHYPNELKITDICSACHLSETHFRRIFHRAMNCSPMQYVNLVRIETACKMLHVTQKPIKSIAVDCGFPTITSFNRNFKSITGMAPKQWRALSDLSYESKMHRTSRTVNGHMSDVADPGDDAL